MYILCFSSGLAISNYSSPPLNGCHCHSLFYKAVLQNFVKLMLVYSSLYDILNEL